MELSGFDELNRKLERMAKDMPQKRDIFLMQEAELLKKRTKANTPVSTSYPGHQGGTLREAWKRTAPANGSIDVYNNTEYAAHVEWGHRQKPGRFVPAIGKRLKKGYVPGKKMLHRGLDELKTSFKEDAEAILASILNA